MDKRLTVFWNELQSQCDRHNSVEFIFKIEYWGILWTPWFIYVNEEVLRFSANDINENDIEILIKNGYIEFVEELVPLDNIDLEIKKYRIKTKANIWHIKRLI